MNLYLELASLAIIQLLRRPRKSDAAYEFKRLYGYDIYKLKMSPACKSFWRAVVGIYVYGGLIDEGHYRAIYYHFDDNDAAREKFQSTLKSFFATTATLLRPLMVWKNLALEDARVNWEEFGVLKKQTTDAARFIFHKLPTTLEKILCDDMYFLPQLRKQHDIWQIGGKNFAFSRQTKAILADTVCALVCADSMFFGVEREKLLEKNATLYYLLCWHDKHKKHQFLRVLFQENEQFFVARHPEFNFYAASRHSWLYRKRRGFCQ
jgi:hypothetical protein